MTSIAFQQLLFIVSLKLCGAVLGYILPIIDAVIYALYLHPERSEAEALKRVYAQKKFVAVFREAETLLQQPLHFIHRGIVFFAAFCVLAIFILTSANSALGSGMFVGFGIHILLAMFPYRKDITKLQERFFLGLDKHVSSSTILSLIVIVCGIIVFAIVS